MRRFYLTGLWEAGELETRPWPRPDRYPHGTNTAEHEDGEFKDFFKCWIFRTRAPFPLLLPKFALAASRKVVAEIALEPLNPQDSSIPGGVEERVSV